MNKENKKWVIEENGDCILIEEGVEKCRLLKSEIEEYKNNPVGILCLALGKIK